MFVEKLCISIDLEVVVLVTKRAYLLLTIKFLVGGIVLVFLAMARVVTRRNEVEVPLAWISRDTQERLKGKVCCLLSLQVVFL